MRSLSVSPRSLLTAEALEQHILRDRVGLERTGPNDWRALVRAGGADFDATLLCLEAGTFCAQASVMKLDDIQHPQRNIDRAIQKALVVLGKYVSGAALIIQDGVLILKSDRRDVTEPSQALRCIGDLIDVYPAVASEFSFQLSK